MIQQELGPEFYLDNESYRAELLNLAVRADRITGGKHECFAQMLDSVDGDGDIEVAIADITRLLPGHSVKRLGDRWFVIERRNE